MGIYKLEQSHVKNQFITNPDWRIAFLKHYPEWTVESWLQNALELLKKNGYRLEIAKRYSTNPERPLYHVVDIALYKNDEWQYELQMNDCEWEMNFLIDAICDYEIDFSTFV